MATDNKKKIHYVNNKEFLQAIVERKQLLKDAEESGEPKPQISNYLGECILKIANHLSYRPNFINYTYRDEMISDGIENSLQYIDNFDPEKSKNPFAYFTQIIYFAFIRRITKEKKQQKIKDRILKRSNISDMISVMAHDDEADYQTQYIDFLDKYNFSDDDVDKKKEKKEKK